MSCCCLFFAPPKVTHATVEYVDMPSISKENLRRFFFACIRPSIHAPPRCPVVAFSSRRPKSPTPRWNTWICPRSRRKIYVDFSSLVSGPAFMRRRDVLLLPFLRAAQSHPRHGGIRGYALDLEGKPT